MKIIIYFTAVLMSFTTATFSQSLLDYQTGTSVDVQSGASICADSVIMNGTFTGDGTICGLLYTLNLTMIMEGFYDPSFDLMVRDTVTAYLRNAAAPYSLVDSTKSALNSSGTGTFTFSNPINGVNYYILLKHRNSIETWSKTTQVFTGGSLTYSFTTTVTQAYGNNLKQVDIYPVTFAVFSGDVNQNGYIDLSDVILIYNDAAVFTSGYINTDVNGDNISDLTDVLIAYNNSVKFVSVKRP